MKCSLSGNVLMKRMRWQRTGFTSAATSGIKEVLISAKGERMENHHISGGPIQAKTSELAIAALVCGVASISNPFQAFALGIVAIVLGIRARSAIDASKGAMSGSGLALTGLVCGIVSLAGAFLYFGFVFLTIMVFFLPLALRR